MLLSLFDLPLSSVNDPAPLVDVLHFYATWHFLINPRVFFMRIPHRDRVRDPSALHIHRHTQPCLRTHKATLRLRVPHGIGTVSLDPRGSAGGWKEVNNAKGRGYVNLVWLISLRHAIRSDIYICMYHGRPFELCSVGGENALFYPSPSFWPPSFVLRFFFSL